MAVKILVTLSLIIAFVSGLPTQSPTVNEVTENDFSSLIDPHPETFDNRLIEDPGKFEGDIIVEKNDAPTTAIGIRGKFAAPNDYNLWPKGVIPYQIQGSVGNQARNNIKQAIEHIQRKTCIRFKERTSADAYFVNIIRGNGCYSMVGRTMRGGQPLSLGFGCEHPVVVVHELMHAIGFFHSHMRVDRDEHLIIHWNNIAPGAKPQFERLNNRNSRLITKNFDFASVMLYGPTTFSRDRYSITMSPKDKTQKLVDVQYKQGLSDDDAFSINKLYRCRS